MIINKAANKEKNMILRFLFSCFMASTRICSIIRKVKFEGKLSVCLF